MRFSTGRPVRPSDVERGIERSLHAGPGAFGVLSGIASIADDDANTPAVARRATWGSDYPSTSTFLDQFSCRSFVPGSEANLNTSQFCDPRADGLMRRATAVQATDPRAADDLWARAEQRVLAMAPAIPLFNLVHTDLVSTRIRNDQYHPHWGLLLDQVSVR